MKIVIIGGGAAGMAAAISARRFNENTEITILERMDRVGKKILATGNGCCNFSNVNTTVSNYHGKHPDFVKYALMEFTVDYTVSFFNSLGIVPNEKEDGKLYPYSDQASAVLDVLRREVVHCGVEVITGFDVKSVAKTKNGFKITSKDGKTVNCTKLIMAAGGCASPALGSDGSGFELMKSLGHKVSSLQPALVQLKTDTNSVKSLKGIKIQGSVSILQNDSVIATQSGEVLFTDYGISGPPVFQLSATVPFSNNLEASIDLMPNHSPKDVFDILENRRYTLAHLTMEDYFVGLLNKRMGNLIARRAGIEKLSYSVDSLTRKQLWAMANEIKDYRLKITGTNGFKNAQVTAGGVFTDQFDAHTMESKIVKNLYCCGEVLDIYGDCGGYNLQWAWSSGFLAGKSAVL
jgi:hypothetical protein